MVLGLVILGSGSFACGVVLAIAAKRFAVDADPLAAEIEEMLPGSQCGQCGFPGCSNAAQALAEGTAPATICPPGGSSLARSLSEKLGIPLDAAALEQKQMVAQIDGALCIGCTKCFRACPTDAIVGAPKQIHGVVSAYCTACRQCVDICPTETVTLVEVSSDINNWTWPRPDAA